MHVSVASQAESEIKLRTRVSSCRVRVCVMDHLLFAEG